jgi:uncharacterized protein
VTRFRAIVGPVLLALALGACGGAAAPSVNQAATAQKAIPALTGRVVDKANILSPAQESALSEKSAALETRTGHQFVIVTLPSLDGRTIESVSLALGNGWKIGRKGHDDGVLLVVAPAEREVRIEVGDGLARVLSDGDAAKIIQTVILPEFREARLPMGISKGADAIVARLSEPKSSEQSE